MEDTEATDPLVRIDRERCIACFECVDVCPQTAATEFPVFERGSDGYPVVAGEESCIGCLSCEVDCRADAIRVEVGEDRERVAGADARAKAKCSAMF